LLGRGARRTARKQDASRHGARRRRSWRRRVGALLAAVVAGPLVGVPAATAPSAGADLYVPWTIYLPGWTDEFIPSSDNDCVAGRPACLKQTLKELNRVLELNGKNCNHNAIFAMAYLRMTQTYGWSRNVSGYYEDVPFANHQDAVFARYFTDAYYDWRSGRRGTVPKAWLMAFDASQAKLLTGTGDLMLAMNAHINRDLPFVVAAVGLVAPDGSSRKRDYDKVEDFLAKAASPMLREAAARFDPSIDDADDPLGVLNGTLMQVIALWRENAWRNAERLVSARNADERAQVAASIEAEAATIGRTIQVGFAANPLLSDTGTRDRYCQANHGAPAPNSYPFGTPDPYGP
jgi:hypothetical protein